MDEAVHVAITRRVRPENVSAFEQALTEFARESLHAPGTRGVQFLYPAPGPDTGPLEYGILRTFSDRAAREAFYTSPLYLEWQESVRPLVEGDAIYRDLHGLEALFWDPSGRPPPPKWKMALLTWLAVWPVSMTIPKLVVPFIGHMLPKPLLSGVIAAGITATLAWVAMPLLVKIAHRWLHPAASPPSPSSRS
ncbi:MAG: antibiotic biosynthesis monooxygenase [Verrucomicrobium sp.]